MTVKRQEPRGREWLVLRSIEPDPDATRAIRDLEKWKAKMVGAQLHFDPAKNV